MPITTSRQQLPLVSGIYYLVVFAAAYFLAGQLGKLLTVQPSNFTTFWPPSGLYVAVLLLFPMRIWPWLIGGAVLGNITFDLSCGRFIGYSALFTTGNTLEAACGAWMVRRFLRAVPAMDRLKDVVALTLLSAVVSTGISATVGSLVIHGVLHGSGFWLTWVAWWSSDALSVMIVAPLVIVAFRPQTRADLMHLVLRTPFNRRVEFVLWVGLFALVLWLVFINTSRQLFLYDYLLWPILIWAALRFRMVSVVIINAFLGIFAAWALSSGHMPAAVPSDILSPTVSVQVLVALSVLSSLFVSAVTAERDRTERLIRSREKTLREQERRLDSLYSNMTEGVALHELVADESGQLVDYRIIDCNPRYETMVGLHREEVKGKLSTEVYRTDDPPYLSLYVRVALSEISERFNVFFEPLGKHFDISVAPWGKNGFATIFTDVTEKKRMDESRFQSQKLESLGLLAGGIAHDFNNLLGGMFGYMDMTQEFISKGDPVRAQSSLGKALGVFERARNLTSQLVTFAKGGAPLRRAGDLGLLLRESVQFALSGSGVRPVFDIAEGLWPCEFDRHQLAQVIDNMVINAKHAMANVGELHVGAENVQVESGAVAGLAPGRHVRFSIRDHGTGIARENLGKVFDPFFTTKQAGSGLGLATSYSIIKKHNGVICVESEPGEGSVFHVYLPASDCTPSAEAGIATATVDGNGRRVLVMDDEEYIREISVDILQGMNFSVTVSHSGDDTLEQCRSAVSAGNPFTAAILDLTVPGGRGGREIVEELRCIDPSITMIATSGYSDDPVIAQPASFGFAFSLRKPFSRAEMAGVMGSVVGEHTGPKQG